MYRHSTIEPKLIIVKFQHSSYKENILKYTTEKRNKSHTNFQDLEWCWTSQQQYWKPESNGAKPSEFWRKRKPSKNFIPSQSIKQVRWHHKSIFRHSRSQSLLQIQSFSRTCKGCLKQLGLRQRRRRSSPGEMWRAVPAH